MEIISRHPDKLVLVVVGEHSLHGKIPREQRTLTVSGDPGTQREALAVLVRSIDERVRRTALENVERKLGLDGQAPPPSPVEEPPKEEEIPTAPPAPQSAPPPSLDTQSFASVTSEVLELTETVEATGETEAQPAQPAPQAAPQTEPKPEHEPVPESSSEPEESLGALNIKKLHDILGNDAEISGFGGKLRLVVPLKVVQGLYTFYLEQRGPTQFKGFLISPQGTRHTVEFDLRNIEDIKQVFDRVVLGRQDFV